KISSLSTSVHYRQIHWCCIMANSRTPRSSSEISREWLEFILGEHESRRCPGSTVEVTSFQVNPVSVNKADVLNLSPTPIP
ncbi:hypothetical protein Hamer_G002549, partial [Homarus americanus]